MADSGEQAKNGGRAERFLGHLRDLHIAIGAVALTGAILLPQIAAFSTVAAYEGVNALAHEELRQATKKQSKR